MPTREIQIHSFTIVLIALTVMQRNRASSNAATFTSGSKTMTENIKTTIIRCEAQYYWRVTSSIHLNGSRRRGSSMWSCAATTALAATMIESAGLVITITEAPMPSFTSGAGHIVLTPRVSKANDVI